jgi:hypothetical protein
MVKNAFGRRLFSIMDYFIVARSVGICTHEVTLERTVCSSLFNLVANFERNTMAQMTVSPQAQI